MEIDKKGPLGQVEHRQRPGSQPCWGGYAGGRRIGMWPAREP